MFEEGSIADRIRGHVLRKYVAPARSRGERSFTVRAGDVHSDLALINRMPNVCSALGSRKFVALANVRLLQRTGPAAGSNVYFTFALDQASAGQTLPEQSPPLAREGPTEAPQMIDLSEAVVLVSCVKSKRATSAPAKDLYISSWFRKVRDLIEAQRAPWFILSAGHGLLPPDSVIEPYERTLNAMHVAERREWASRVLQDLLPQLNGTRRVVFFAGERYREFLVDALRTLGVHVDIPMEGLRLGCVPVCGVGARSA